MADYAPNLGRLCGEAHAGSIIEDPKLALKMLAEVEGSTLTLDQTHYTYAGIVTESLRPLMKYAHICMFAAHEKVKCSALLRERNRLPCGC